MDTMDIALPSEMKDFVRDEVNGGGYSSASEYIRDLIRQQQRRKAEATLEALLLEGLDSGPANEMTAKDWNNLRDRLKTLILHDVPPRWGLRIEGGRFTPGSLRSPGAMIVAAPDGAKPREMQGSRRMSRHDEGST